MRGSQLRHFLPRRVSPSSRSFSLPYLRLEVVVSCCQAVKSPRSTIGEGKHGRRLVVWHHVEKFGR